MNTTFYDLMADFLKICLPMFTVAGGGYILLKAFFRKEQELKYLELKQIANKETRMLKLQAYERMALFLERISPDAVIARVYEPDMLSQELQLSMVRAIRAEFEHNLSQQIYISNNAWNLISSSKDEMIKALSMICQQVPPETTAVQLSRIILESIANSGQQLPTKTALDFLKAEAREWMI